MSSDKLFDIISLNIYSKILNYDSYNYFIILYKYLNNPLSNLFIDKYLKNSFNIYKNINIDIINDYNKQLFINIYNLYIKKHSKSINYDLKQTDNINNNIYKYNKTISTKENIKNIIKNIDNNSLIPFSLSIKKIKNKSLYIHTKDNLDITKLISIKSGFTVSTILVQRAMASSSPPNI